MLQLLISLGNCSLLTQHFGEFDLRSSRGVLLLLGILTTLSFLLLFPIVVVVILLLFRVSVYLCRMDGKHGKRPSSSPTSWTMTALKTKQHGQRHRWWRTRTRTLPARLQARARVRARRAMVKRPKRSLSPCCIRYGLCPRCQTLLILLCGPGLNPKLSQP